MKLKKIYQSWKVLLANIVNRDEFNSENFTVNLQPFIDNLVIPTRKGTTDYSFFSFDSFHLAQKGNALATNALWNNMFQRNGNKSHSWNYKDFYNYLCPNEEHPYIYTRVNSF